MDKYYIGTLNNISKKGLCRLTDKFELTEDVDKANGIIVRSFKMHDMDFSDELLAIGRAGAGVNNIPLDRCAEKGIVVFNSGTWQIRWRTEHTCCIHDQLAGSYVLA